MQHQRSVATKSAILTRFRMNITFERDFQFYFSRWLSETTGGEEGSQGISKHIPALQRPEKCTGKCGGNGIVGAQIGADHSEWSLRNVPMDVNDPKNMILDHWDVGWVNISLRAPEKGPNKAKNGVLTMKKNSQWPEQVIFLYWDKKWGFMQKTRNLDSKTAEIHASAPQYLVSWKSGLVNFFGVVYPDKSRPLGVKIARTGWIKVVWVKTGGRVKKSQWENHQRDQSSQQSRPWKADH